MYDKVIVDHYSKVADDEGHLESCTMADSKIRDLETAFIINGVNAFLQESGKRSRLGSVRLLDVGCGNGFTLEVLQEKFPQLDIDGVEFTPNLRKLANARGLRCEVRSGDVRDLNTLPSNQDIIVCQRVLINLLDSRDQASSLSNLSQALNQGGYLIIIEAFNTGLQNLNLCREELGLNLIPPAHHNLYLNDDFFDLSADLDELETSFGPHILSTHYFVSRVLHDVALAATDASFVRNSLFTKFFDDALPLGVGNFSPLQCRLFKKL